MTDLRLINPINASPRAERSGDAGSPSWIYSKVIRRRCRIGVRHDIELVLINLTKKSSPYRYPQSTRPAPSLC